MKNGVDVLVSVVEQKKNNGNSSSGFTMKGAIRCGNFKCQKLRTEPVCPHCGYSTCYISIYWNKKLHTFRKSMHDNMALDYPRAVRMLEGIRIDIDRKKFTPFEWTKAAVKARRLDNKALEWLAKKSDDAKSGQLSHETLKDYKGYVNNYWIPKLGEYDVRDVDYDILEAYLNELTDVISDFSGRKLRSKTRKNNMYALHEFFVWLAAKKIIEKMPIFPVVKKGNDATKKTALTYEQQLEGLMKLPVIHREVFEFGFEIGLRPGETCAVRIKDLDLKKKVIKVQRTWSGSNLKESTKEDTEIDVPLSDRAYEIAKRIVTERMSGIPDITVFDEFLFINPSTGRHYTRWTLWDLWKTHVGNVTHYEASRHSFCTQIIDCCDNNVFDAQKLMRHADVRSTLAYFHPTSHKYFEIVNRRGKSKNNVVDIKKKKKGKGK